jgi:uncharacterized protein YwqG
MANHGDLERAELGAIATRLRAANITDAEHLATFARRAWRLRATRVAPATIADGQSRFGGTPETPPDFVWPTRDGRPLAFLAQIDLTQVRAHELPASGWLLFFYDAEEQPWGLEPRDATGSKMIYVEPTRALSPRLPPQGHTSFAACALAIEPTVGLPEHPENMLAPPEPWDDAQGAYVAVSCAIANDAAGPDRVYHHLLGYPQTVQVEMRGQCERVSRGIGHDDRDARADELVAARATSWRLLLQLDTDDGDDGPGWRWGDCGKLYVWIRDTDLAARAFDKIWLVLQCT